MTMAPVYAIPLIPTLGARAKALFPEEPTAPVFLLS